MKRFVIYNVLNVRKYSRALAGALVFLLVSIPVQAQIQYAGDGPRHEAAGLPVHSIEIPAEALSRLKKSSGKKFPLVFAVPFPVDLHPGNDGVLTGNADGSVTWQISLHSPEARSLSVVLEPFHLPEGAELYIYNSGKETVAGAYTSANNKEFNRLLTSPIAGDTLWLEYTTPYPGNLAEQIGISSVQHDFLGITNPSDSKDQFFGGAGPCNVDILCPEGAEWQLEKQSVVRLIIQGYILCTGVLLNTLGEELPKALMLSANHCLKDQEAAQLTLFFFGYESPWCEGRDGITDKSISGSNLLSTSTNLDFSLVELSAFPPFSYQPYLSGWNAHAVAPDSGVCIHHPNGDVKKITYDSEAPVVSGFESFDPLSFWKVLQWEEGTTEAGSSGAPLYNQSRQVVGYLSGGEARCGRSVNDYFGRFDKAWDNYPLQEEQLKVWLDPSGSGLKQAGGYDPYAPNKHFCDTLSALEPGETIILEAYPDPGTGVLTGHNADSITRYAVYLENPGHLNATGLEVHVAGVQASSVQDSVCFYIWAAEEGRPAAVLDSAVYLLEGFLDGMKRFIPLEASLQAAPAFFAGYEIFYATNAPAETQQFALYHSEDRGSGNISWYYHEGQWDPFIHHPLGTRHTALSLTAMVCDELELTTAEKYLHKPGSFRLYPNPATDYVYLETKASPGTRFRLSVYDLAGRIRIKENLICRGNEMRADLRHLSPGLYTLRLESANSVRYAKLMIRYE